LNDFFGRAARNQARRRRSTKSDSVACAGIALLQ
jgi:hypothetical protein